VCVSGCGWGLAGGGGLGGVQSRGGTRWESGVGEERGALALKLGCRAVVDVGAGVGGCCATLLTFSPAATPFLHSPLGAAFSILPLS
jgi:hypothetical protein